MSNFTVEQLKSLNSTVLTRLDTVLCNRVFHAVIKILEKPIDSITFADYAWLFQYLCSNELLYNNHAGGKLLLLSFMFDKVKLTHVDDSSYATNTLKDGRELKSEIDGAKFYNEYIKECKVSSKYSEFDATCLINKLSSSLFHKLIKDLTPCELYAIFRTICKYFGNNRDNDLAALHLSITKLVINEINKFVEA